MKAVRIKSPKATQAQDCAVLEQLPNIGPSLAADLRLIGVHTPRDLQGRDAFVLYQKLNAARARATTRASSTPSWPPSTS
jgi:Pathogenicity locus